MEELHLPVPDGGTVHVLDYGGTGPDVLMLHHIGLGPLEWQSVAEALGGRVRAVALALRGHGRCTAQPLPGLAAAEDIRRVVDLLGLSRPVLATAGWMSSVYGLTAAVRDPQLARAVLTLNGTLQPTRAAIAEEVQVIRTPQMLAYFRERFQLDSVRPTWEGMDELIADKVANIRADWMVDESANVEAEVRMGIREVPGGYTTSPSSEAILAPYDLSPQAPDFPDRGLYERITVPLFVIHGTESWDYRSESLEFELERERPPIVVVQLDDAGQFPMYSHPQAVADIIERAAACP